MSNASFTSGGLHTINIDAVLQRAVEKKRVSGVVAAAATRNGVVYAKAFGKADITNNVDMNIASIFRIASMTKAVTSVAVMQLIETGKVSLDGAVAEHLPELAEVRVLDGFEATTGSPRLRAPVRPITVRQLLAHTSGFSYEMWNEDIVAYLAKTGLPSVFAGGQQFLEAPLICDPGDRWEYGISTDWLGRLVERISGVNLNEYFRENILDPLEMTDTHFELPSEKVGRLVKVQQRQQDGSLTEIDFPTPALNGFYSGGGGLVSTASDYLQFTRMLLHGGAFDGARVLAPETIDLMARNQLGELPMPVMKTTNSMLTRDVDFFPGVGKTWGLGFLINTEALAGGRAAGSLCWAGFFNTYYWIDRETGVCAVLLTQQLPFYDGEVIALLHEYEQALYSCVRSE